MGGLFCTFVFLFWRHTSDDLRSCIVDHKNVLKEHMFLLHFKLTEVLVSLLVAAQQWL